MFESRATRVWVQEICFMPSVILYQSVKGGKDVILVFRLAKDNEMDQLQ